VSVFLILFDDATFALSPASWLEPAHPSDWSERVSLFAGVEMESKPVSIWGGGRTPSSGDTDTQFEVVTVLSGTCVHSGSFRPGSSWDDVRKRVADALNQRVEGVDFVEEDRPLEELCKSEGLRLTLHVVLTPVTRVRLFVKAAGWMMNIRGADLYFPDEVAIADVLQHFDAMEGLGARYDDLPPEVLYDCFRKAVPDSEAYIDFQAWFAEEEDFVFPDVAQLREVGDDVHLTIDFDSTTSGVCVTRSWTELRQLAASSDSSCAAEVVDYADVYGQDVLYDWLLENFQ
jgi:hypothetical protein